MEAHTATRVPCLGHALEVKTIDADGRFAGYASVFGVLDAQRDVVRKGAFVRSLASAVPPMKLLWQHRWDEPIGVITRLFEDARGLYVEGKLLLDVARAREAYSLMKAGVVKGLSIGYSVKQWRRNPDSGHRELLDVDLWEVSLVTMPANTQARVTVVKQLSAYDMLAAAMQNALKVLQ